MLKDIKNVSRSFLSYVYRRDKDLSMTNLLEPKEKLIKKKKIE
jgi:hypothetical protein